MQARNFFYYGAKNPKNVANQFGLDLGGLIIKNKLFFFGDWERYRLSQAASTLNSVPTEAMRKGDFSGTGTTIYNPFTGNPDGTGRTAFTGDQIPASLFSSAAQKMAALIPMPLGLPIITSVPAIFGLIAIASTSRSITTPPIGALFLHATAQSQRSSWIHKG